MATLFLLAWLLFGLKAGLLVGVITAVITVALIVIDKRHAKGDGPGFRRLPISRAVAAEEQGRLERPDYRRQPLADIDRRRRAAGAYVPPRPSSEMSMTSLYQQRGG